MTNGSWRPWNGYLAITSSQSRWPPLAYHDTPLPIGFDKTISQPFIVAVMTDLLDPAAGETVLEIGTGLGYQTAVLAQLVRQVWSVEIVEEFALEAAARLRQLGYANVGIRIGDGSRGWAEHAPFDKILVTAAAEPAPPALIEQLQPGGRMVLPLGARKRRRSPSWTRTLAAGSRAGSSSRCASAGSRRWHEPYVRARPERGCALGCRHAVELGGHDEVILVQALDLLGLQRDRGIAPAKGDVRMMALGLGELARPLDEAERLAEILEPVSALDLPAVVEQGPVRRLRQVALALPRWSAAVCRRGTVCSSSRQGHWACCSPRW